MNPGPGLWYSGESYLIGNSVVAGNAAQILLAVSTNQKVETEIKFEWQLLIYP